MKENCGMMINVDESLKNIMYVKKYVWNPATCNCQNGKYLVSIMNDSGIIFDEVINADADKKAKSNHEAKSIDEAK